LLIVDRRVNSPQGRVAHLSMPADALVRAAAAAIIPRYDAVNPRIYRPTRA
jgi:hypothetical protein